MLFEVTKFKEEGLVSTKAGEGGKGDQAGIWIIVSFMKSKSVDHYSTLLLFETKTSIIVILSLLFWYLKSLLLRAL